MHRIDVKILDSRLHDNPPHYATPGAAAASICACIPAPLHVVSRADHAGADRHRHPPGRPRPGRDDPAALGARP